MTCHSDFPKRAGDVLKFWFGPLDGQYPFPTEKVKTWWEKSDSFDQHIRQEYEKDLILAIQGKQDHWMETPRGCLALVILLDQFSRNIYRGTPQSFSQDNKACLVCLYALKQGYDRELHDVEKWFLYMPLMHSEKREDQNKSLECFRQLVENAPPALELALPPAFDFATQHYKIIEQFGRYPHRNQILGRVSTEEEKAFLKKPGSSF